MSEYFRESKLLGEKVKVQFGLSNYATNDLKNPAGAGTSKSAKQVDLANSKPNADKLDIDKLKNIHL